MDFPKPLRARLRPEPLGPLGRGLGFGKEEYVKKLGAKL